MHTAKVKNYSLVQNSNFKLMFKKKPFITNFLNYNLKPDHLLKLNGKSCN